MNAAAGPLTPSRPSVAGSAPWTAGALDPRAAERLAGEWVSEHHPGRTVARVRSHSVLHRRPHDLTWRVGVELDGAGPGEELTLLVHDEGGERSVSELPDDPLLPSLAAVLRDGALEPLLRTAGLGSPSGSGRSGYRTAIVHHPRDGACVLRVQVDEAEAYAKVYARADEAVEAAQRLRAVGTDRLVTRGGRVVRLPRVLAVDADLRTVLLESLTPPGRSAVGSDGHPAAARPLTVDDIATALRALHGHVPSGRLPRVPASEHVSHVRAEQQLVGTLWPALAERVDDAIRTAAAVLHDDAPAAAEAALCHGDFTPGQLMRTPEGLALLDLDTVALGDPAGDIGRFLAYEHVRTARCAGSETATSETATSATSAQRSTARASDAFLTAYGPVTRATDPTALDARVWAHRRLDLALIALRAARRLKGARCAVALDLLDDSDPAPATQTERGHPREAPMTTTARDEAVDALEPFAQLPDWLAAPMVPGRLEASLRAHVPELRDGRLELLECRADRLRAKEASWLVRCRAVVAAPTSATGEGKPAEKGDAVEVVLVGELIPPTRPDPFPPGGAPPAVSVGFGQPGYELVLPDLRLRLRVEDEDPGLPSLGALTDPGASARIIQRLLRAGAYPTATVVSSTPNVVRYKPGSRCTIVCDLAYDPPSSRFPNPVVAKTHQGDKGAVAHEAMTALWNTGLARGDEVLLAEPLGYLPEERVLLQGPVPEDQTLKELARLAFERMDPALLDDLRTQLRRTAAALAALHTSGARYSRSVAWTDELAETREVLDRLSLTVPGLREAGEPMLTRLEALDRATGADPFVSAHHDFRPAQVLLGGGRLGFIDFDGAAMAEPALDLGRFRGKLRDIGVTALAGAPERCRSDLLADRLQLLDEFCELFVDEYRAHAPVTAARVLLWETIDLLTALLHTWSKVRLPRVEPRLAILVHQLRTADLTP